MIEVLGHNTCTYCKQAIQYLASQGKSFNYMDARDEANKERVDALRAEHVAEVPQIWIDGVRIGGYKELKDLV